jgi:hypothetical protein
MQSIALASTAGRRLPDLLRDSLRLDCRGAGDHRRHDHDAGGSLTTRLVLGFDL